MGALVAVLNKKGEGIAKTALNMFEMLADRRIEAFGIASPDNVKIGKTIQNLQHQEVDSRAIIGYAFTRIFETEEPQPTMLKNATIVFEGRTFLPSENLGIGKIAEKTGEDYEDLAKTIVSENEGDFAFVIANHERIIAGRDPVGVRPLYYGENKYFTALASERKMLWKIGIENPLSFPLGHILIANDHGFRFKPVKTLSYRKPTEMSFQKAAKELEILLRQSVKKRIKGLKEIAIAFSGGLDSSIIACLAKKSTSNVQLVHVSLENQAEAEYAKTVADELKLPIKVFLYKEKEVEQVLPKVLWTAENSTPLSAAIGIPIYWVAEKAATMDYKVVLAGQGADELFAGYKKYVDTYLRRGAEEARRKVFEDIITLCEANLERDSKIFNFHNVELRLPFACYALAEFAVSLPLNLKIQPQDNDLRKLVLRKVAQNLGLPSYVAAKPKKAIQYTTGVDKILKKLASKQGVCTKEYLHRVFQDTMKKMSDNE